MTIALVRNSFFTHFVIIAVWALHSSCHSPTLTAAEPEDIGSPTWPSKVPRGKIDFTKHVRPILIINCMECHNQKDAPQNAGFAMDTKKLMMTTGTNPPALVPGKPEKSPLIAVLKLGPGHHKSMPPAPDKIWGVRLEILKRWIKEGAEWPEDVRLIHPRDVKKW